MPLSVPRRTLRDRLHCTTRAHIPRASHSAASNVRAKLPRSSAWESTSTTTRPGSPVSTKFIRSDDEARRDPLCGERVDLRQRQLAGGAAGRVVAVPLDRRAQAALEIPARAPAELLGGA